MGPNFSNKFNSFLKHITFLKHAVVLEATLEITQSIILSQHPLVPPSLKFWSIAKASCCSVSLVTAYASSSVPEPRIATAFYICCLASTAGYKYSGGNNVTAIALLAVANNTKA